MITEKKIRSGRTIHGLCGIALTALVLLASCSKESASQPEQPSMDGLLNFVPEFVGVSSDAPQTMALIDPNFTSKLVFDMGLFICDNNTTYPSSVYHPHAAGYFNMKGHCEANRTSSTDPATYKWTFTPSNTTIPYSEAGVRIVGGATVDVYAYTPYTTGSIADPKHIPYVASQDDYMYCEPKIGVSSGTVNIQLKHAMTCFSFKIFTTKVANAVLKQIKVTDKSGATMIASGDFDATTGIVTPATYASATTPVYIDINKTLPSGSPDETTFDVIVPPIVDYHDNDIEISLMFSYGSGENEVITEFLTPVAIPASSGTLEDGKYQFKRGYRYIYQIEVDDYNKFTPLGFEEWNTVPDQTIHVDI